MIKTKQDETKKVSNVDISIQWARKSNPHVPASRANDAENCAYLLLIGKGKLLFSAVLTSTDINAVGRKGKHTSSSKEGTSVVFGPICTFIEVDVIFW